MSEKTETLEQAVLFFGEKLAAVALPEGWTVAVETSVCNSCDGVWVLAQLTDVARNRSLKVRVSHSDTEDGMFTKLYSDWERFESEILPMIVENLDDIEDGDDVDTTVRKTTVHVVLVTASGSLEDIIADFLAQMEQEEQDE